MATDHEIAVNVANFSELGQLKFAVSAVETVVFLLSVPLFMSFREHPVIRYRSWSVNLWTVFTVVMAHWLETAMSMPYWVPYERFQWVLLSKAMACLPTYHAIFMRHYFLLRLPVLQNELLDHKTMVDPDKYKETRAKLERVKLLSTEFAAWCFYIPHAAITVGVYVYFAATVDIDAFLARKSTMLANVRSGIYVLEVLSASGWLFWYLPRAPKENFRIGEQFYAFMLLTDAVFIVTLTVMFLFRTSYAAQIFDDAFGTMCVFTIVMINALHPFATIYREKRRLFTSSARSSMSSVNINSHDDRSSTSSQNQAPSLAKSPSEVTATSATSTAPMMRQAGHQPSAKAKGSHSLTIPKILADQTMRGAFCQYLAREFSMESLMFIEAVKSYRETLSATNMPGMDQIRSATEKILEEFIVANSVNEVNLPKKCVDKIHQNIRDVIEATVGRDRAAYVFDEGAEHIEAMLAVNHLRKFQASSIFKEMMESK
ncbi:hypothetical protein BC831DRAFT_284696 [Entophlyctis helioformis]|nr:hypothetical protein BC831DRAFT_284696 [Entophlyctis helioformis]